MRVERGETEARNKARNRLETQSLRIQEIVGRDLARIQGQNGFRYFPGSRSPLIRAASAIYDKLMTPKSPVKYHNCPAAA